MKCSNCNSNHLRAVEGLVQEGLYSDGKAYLNGSAYICLECGHVEIFSSELLKGARKAEEREKKIEELKKQEVEKAAKCSEKVAILTKKKDGLEKEVASLTEKSQDENITVKLQKEYLDSISAKKAEIETVQREIVVAQRVVNDLPRVLSQIENRRDL